MEFILALVIIIVLCKIIGVSNEMIGLGMIGLVELIIIAMTLLFAFMCIVMAFSRKRRAVFSRLDKEPNGKYKVAYYTVDGEEYPCFFPSEVKLSSRMYMEGASYTVLLNKRFGRVYDIWNILTCVIGFFCSGAAVVGSIMFLEVMIKM